MHDIATIKHMNKQEHKRAMKRIEQDKKAIMKLVQKTKRSAG